MAQSLRNKAAGTKMQSEGLMSARKIRSTRQHSEAQQAYRAEHPFCQICLLKDRYRMAQHTHHIEALAKGGEDTDSNRLSVCIRCHDSIHTGSVSAKQVAEAKQSNK